ncbi:MAG: hypothetical protein HY226_03045 [Candidatus Vogelbacteria bacterium]|nr:hypothetical protein [Candidatus Vogelbacteria bacterium]
MTKKELKQHKSEVLKLFKKNQQSGRQSLCTDFEEILDLTHKEFSTILSKLFKDKKLESFGNEIVAYKGGFRFPEEIRFILRKLLRSDINSETYSKANEIVDQIERSVDKANIVKVTELHQLWAKNFPFVQVDIAKYLHRHFGYLTKLEGKLPPKSKTRPQPEKPSPKKSGKKSSKKK